MTLTTCIGGGVGRHKEKLIIGAILQNVWLERKTRLFRNCASNTRTCLFHIKHDLIWWICTIEGAETGQQIQERPMYKAGAKNHCGP